MEFPKCEKCDNLSTITVQSSGHFCQDCFLDYFRQKFRRILGASKLIRKGDVVVLGFDGSLASLAILDILQLLSKTDNSNPKYQKKNRYESKVLHIARPGLYR